MKEHERPGEKLLLIGDGNSEHARNHRSGESLREARDQIKLALARELVEKLERQRLEKGFDQPADRRRNEREGDQTAIDAMLIAGHRLHRLSNKRLLDGARLEEILGLEGCPQLGVSRDQPGRLALIEGGDDRGLVSKFRQTSMEIGSAREGKVDGFCGISL